MSSFDEGGRGTPRRLRFLHIPKAGGTTLNAILARQFAPARTFSFTGDFDADVRSFQSLRRNRVKQLELIIGHASLETGIAVVDDAITFTMLRDPIARAKSFCQHASEGKSAYLLADNPPESFDLDAFLWSGDPHLSNQQTKMLVNTGDIGDGSVIREIGPDAARDLALENLFERVEIYGLQESFDESLLMFARRFGWSMPWYYSRNRSSGSRRLRFEPRHIDRIAELNDIDLAVYRVARDRFAEKRSSQSAAEVRAFRTANRAFGPAMAAWDQLNLRALYWYRRLSGQLP